MKTISDLGFMEQECSLQQGLTNSWPPGRHSTYMMWCDA